MVQDQAGDPERRSKMMAEKRLPRGTTDVQGLSGAQHVPDARAGMCEQIDYSKL